MKVSLFILLGLILRLETFSQSDSRQSQLKIDFQKLVSRADIIYNKPVTRSEEGLPVGNGVMGTLVWTTPSALHFQINRVDVFGNNSNSNNFFERHTDYCGGLGFVDVEIVNDNNDIFAGEDFRQDLSCYTGVVTTRGNEVESRVFLSQDQDVLVIDVKDSRKDPGPVFVNLRPLRDPVSRKGDHSAISTVRTNGNQIILTQEFREGSYYCGSAIVIESTGRQTVAFLEHKGLARLLSGKGNGDLVIFAATAASFDPLEDLIASATRKLEDAKKKGVVGVLDANKIWWKNFWNRSFIQLHSADGVADFVEKNYSYYLYVMASASRGKYPPKFNGMLWSTGGDERKWGNLYWGANQSCIYNALLQANRFELMDPMFNMYSSASPSFAAAATQQWGSQGMFIPETVAFDGLGTLPDDLAAEMRALYLLEKPWEARSHDFVRYAQTKMPFLSRWNWKKDEGWKNGNWIMADKGKGAFGHVTHIFSRGAKIAYQYWLKYEYTKDKTWLKNRGYPILKGVAEFYRNFPGLKKESDGKYHLYHVNDNESVWGGHNTVEEISSMMGIFPVAIKASELLGLDPDLAKSWQEILDNLSPLPTKAIPGGSGKTWIRSLPPIVQGNGDAMPDPNTMPAWFFDLCNMESDKEMLAIANKTFDLYFPAGISTETKMNVLSKLPVAGSLLGRTESTRYLIPNQISTAETEIMANRMDMREGPQTTSVQRLGRAAEALQLALCQSVPSSPGKEPVIRVFAAWPMEWDAEFTLPARGAFLVTGSVRNQNIRFVEIRSQAGGVCNIRNPWGHESVRIFRNGKPWKKSATNLITFPTTRGESYALVKNGETY